MPGAPARPKEVDRPKLLIGEGQDEVRFFEALLKHLTIPDVQVLDFGGSPASAARSWPLPRRTSS